MSVFHEFTSKASKVPFLSTVNERMDGELFSNEYKLNISITPHTANLKEQTEYFERLKNLFEQVFANTITTWRDEKLYPILKKNTNNRFIELPKPPYDQIMAAVCFCKANSILDSKPLSLV